MTFARGIRDVAGHQGHGTFFKPQWKVVFAEIKLGNPRNEWRFFNILYDIALHYIVLYINILYYNMYMYIL